MHYFIFYLLPLARLKQNGRKNATEMQLSHVF